MYTAYNAKFYNELVNNTSIKTTYEAFGNTAWHERYMLNSYQFSAAKDLSETKAMQALVFQSESFKDFKEKASEITDIFNDQWLRVEMDSCKRGAVMGENFRQIMETSDLYPYWEYKTEEDDRVRDEHAALEGQIFRLGDPESDACYPPNDFNCRCHSELVDNQELKESGKEVTKGLDILEKNDPETGKPYVDEQFRFNPGVQGALPNNSSYSEVLSSANKGNAELFNFKPEIKWPEITIKENYDLNKDNILDFIYDLQGATTSGQDYKIKEDILMRVKNHMANYNNFIEDIEERNIKGIINAQIGDYSESSYKDYGKMNKEQLLKEYPYLKIKELFIEDGDSLLESIDKVRKAFEEIYENL